MDRCPHCGCWDITARPAEFGRFGPDGVMHAYRDVDCDGCGARWTETYMLVQVK
jgi:hypothetical protein